MQVQGDNPLQWANTRWSNIFSNIFVVHQVTRIIIRYAILNIVSTNWQIAVLQQIIFLCQKYFRFCDDWSFAFGFLSNIEAISIKKTGNQLHGLSYVACYLFLADKKGEIGTDEYWFVAPNNWQLLSLFTNTLVLLMGSNSTAFKRIFIRERTFIYH